MKKTSTLSNKDIDKLLNQIPWFVNGTFDYAKYPIEHITRDAFSNDRQKISNTIYLLTEMILAGRKDALCFFYGLFEFFKDDIRTMEIIAERLCRIENKQYVNFLFKQIEITESSNTTRIYLNSLIKVLSHYQLEWIENGFRSLIENKKFSYRMKQKFLEILAYKTGY